MKTALLHIGTMKTGTTSIQHSLALAKSRGALGAVRYPLWKGEVHQSRLAVLYCPEGLARWPSLRERYPANDWGLKRVFRRYRSFVFEELRSARSAVISSETFGHLFTPSHAAQFREDLEGLGFRAFHVVLYVRDPADYYLSVVQQSLKMSDQLPLIKEPATFKYEFLQMAETWERAFPGRLIVRKYPPEPHQDVVQDFSDVLEECLGVALPRESLRKNTSLPAESMQILEDYRHFLSADSGGLLTPDAARLAALLSRMADEAPQTSPRLKSELAAHIRSNHAEDAEILRIRYGIDLGISGVGSPTLLPHADSYRVDEIVESVDPEIVNQLLLRVAGYEPERSLLRSVASQAFRAVRRNRPE